MFSVVLVSLLLTLNIFQPCSSVSIVNFEHVIAGWEWKKIMEQSIKVEQQ